jgi:diacylglycerol kinase family enzyme
MMFVLSGSHLDVEGVKYVKVKEFTLTRKGGIGGNLTIDGEKVVGEKLTVRVSPIPLNIFAL